MSQILIIIYGQPENYPPTINAIEYLSNHASTVDVFYRAHQNNGWNFRDNVTIIPDGEVISPKTQESLSLYKKLKVLLNFCRGLKGLTFQNNYDAILIYDGLALFTYQLIRPLIKNNHVLWYHNHDVIESNNLRKYSLTWWAERANVKMMRFLDIFSLPSNERKKYFQLTNLKGKYFFLPNFPSKRFYSRFKTCNIDKSTIKLIYQGAVNGGHGLELCLEMCTRKINGKKVELHVAGPSNKPYLKHLRDLAEQYKVSSQFYYHGLIPYNSLPHLTSSCQIGIGINIPSRIIYKTGGTASNKIYEYAALGLPVLYYDDAHYKEHLKSFEWAKPVKLNLLSLNNVIEEVDLNYEKLSFEANNAFLERLNFEVNFEKVIRHLKEIIEYKYTLKKRDT